MAEPDVVRSLRDQALAKPPQRIGALDLLIGAVALIAVAALGYFGLGWVGAQSRGPTGPSSPSVMSAGLATPEIWTDEDNVRCQRIGSAAAKKPHPGEPALVDRTIAEGFANISAVLTCKIATKSTRFCDPAERAVLVGLVNDYVGKIDMIVAGLSLQGAPMAIMGEMVGGEVAGGSAVYDIMKESTIEVMQAHSRDVSLALQGLARGSIITAGDFGFMGMGTHPIVERMLNDVQVTANLCA